MTLFIRIFSISIIFFSLIFQTIFIYWLLGWNHCATSMRLAQPSQLISRVSTHVRAEIHLTYCCCCCWATTTKCRDEKSIFRCRPSRQQQKQQQQMIWELESVLWLNTVAGLANGCSPIPPSRIHHFFDALALTLCMFTQKFIIYILFFG